MWIGCVSPVRLYISQISTSPSVGFSVVGASIGQSEFARAGRHVRSQVLGETPVGIENLIQGELAVVFWRLSLPGVRSICAVAMDIRQEGIDPGCEVRGLGDGEGLVH